MGNFSCAKRAADPTNESATCKQWCGNSETCLHVEPDEDLVDTMIRYYHEASPEEQAYLRGEGKGGKS